MLRQFARLFPAASAGGTMGARRHGQCQMDRRSPQGRAGSRWHQGRRCTGCFQRAGRAGRADAPDFMKSLDLDHARDGEVMIAYAMNGEQLPLLNGFPLRLIVPGWYSTYWVKMLSEIEVLNQPDTNYWTKVAYTIPDTPHASIKPGET